MLYKVTNKKSVLKGYLAFMLHFKFVNCLSLEFVVPLFDVTKRLKGKK